MVRRLVGLEGKTLLALKKADIERLLGGHVEAKEIWRLDSQIKKQRASNPVSWKNNVTAQRNTLLLWCWSEAMERYDNDSKITCVFRINHCKFDAKLHLFKGFYISNRKISRL